jgi:ankyrin repeat protein
MGSSLSAAAQQLLTALDYSHGTADKLRAVLASGVDPNTPLRDADSALCLAAMFGRTECVKLLLEAGAHVNHVGSLELTPLMSAKSADAARLLIEHGADVGARDRLMYDALHKVISNVDDVAHASVLLDAGLVVHRYIEAARTHGDRPIPSHLAWAASCGRPGIVELLLERGGSVDETAADGTPVVLSPLNGDPPKGHAMVRLLLERGANPNAEDRWHGSLLARIARRNDPQLVALVLQRGGDAKREQKGVLPTTLLETALGSADVDVLTILLETDTQDVNAANHRGTTPLMVAANSGHLAAIELLLRCGADPQRRDNEGCTALHHAAAGGKLAVFDRLVAAGCDPAALASGSSTFEYACRSGNAELVNVLLDRGAEIDRRVGDQRITPLMLVSGIGHRHIVELLRARGADESLRDADGRTAQDHADAHSAKVAEEWATYRGD